MIKIVRVTSRFIVNPVTMFLLAGLLLADALLLPSRFLAGGRSTMGGIVSDLIGRPSRTSQPPSYDTVVVKEAGGLRVLQPNIESWDEASRVIAVDPAHVAMLYYTPRVFRRGFWSITHEVFDHHIRVVDGGSALTKEDLLAARGAMLDAVFGEEACRSDVLIRLRKEDFAGTRILWPGVAHNGVSLVVLVLFLWSLRWVPEVTAQMKRERVAAALARRECPACGYSIKGLKSETCPECGRSVKLVEIASQGGKT